MNFKSKYNLSKETVNTYLKNHKMGYDSDSSVDGKSLLDEEYEDLKPPPIPSDWLVANSVCLCDFGFYETELNTEENDITEQASEHREQKQNNLPPKSYSSMLASSLKQLTVVGDINMGSSLQVKDSVDSSIAGENENNISVESDVMPFYSKKTRRKNRKLKKNHKNHSGNRRNEESKMKKYKGKKTKDKYENDENKTPAADNTDFPISYLPYLSNSYDSCVPRSILLNIPRRRSWIPQELPLSERFERSLVESFILSDLLINTSLGAVLFMPVITIHVNEPFFELYDIIVADSDVHLVIGRKNTITQFKVL